MARWRAVSWLVEWLDGGGGPWRWWSFSVSVCGRLDGIRSTCGGSGRLQCLVNVDVDVALPD